MQPSSLKYLKYTFTVTPTILDINEEYNEHFYYKRTYIVLHSKSCSERLLQNVHAQKDSRHKKGSH